MEIKKYILSSQILYRVNHNQDTPVGGYQIRL